MSNIRIISKVVDKQYMIDNFPKFKDPHPNINKFKLLEGSIVINKQFEEYFELDSCNTGFYGDYFFMHKKGDNKRTVNELIEWILNHNYMSKKSDFINRVKKVLDQLLKYDANFLVEV